MALSKKQKPDLTKKVHEVPHKPGVYLMRDRFNRVIYVGKARDLRKRVGSYFMPSKMAVADLKTDRKSTRLNSSHRCISYAVFCLKKKKKKKKKKNKMKRIYYNNKIFSKHNSVHITIILLG